MNRLNGSNKGGVDMKDMTVFRTLEDRYGILKLAANPEPNQIQKDTQCGCEMWPIKHYIKRFVYRALKL